MSKNSESKKTEIIDISEFISNEKQVQRGSEIGKAYISFVRQEKEWYYQDKSYIVDYYVKIGDDQGNQLPREFQLNDEGLNSLMHLIQTNQLYRFSEVYLLVLEEIAKYDKGKDIHYYLKILINEPGVAPKIPKTKKKIPICKSCDRMLLRYGFRYKIQRNDLEAKKCPYCGVPLEIEHRYRKPIKVPLNFLEKNCTILPVRAQIGIDYNGQLIQSTLNPKGIADYLKNYQSLFDNHAIGPLNISTGSRYNVSKVVADISFKPLDWRPAQLFPEDFAAF